ncbi:Lactase [Drechslerella dactyloides]|uniref:Lactase n=1 Tax=Drechslerella dactyloides TaxID=74499 RepID=A0AAD6NG25_DREDA|nr:Lactase [Drechslerella dactyloides]
MYLDMMFVLAVTALLLSRAAAQQVYVLTQGPSPRPQCAACRPPATPTYRFSSFSFTQTETYRYATSIAPPATTKTYAAPFAVLKTLLPTSLATTTWGSWSPNDTAATDTADPYGQAAWSSLWAWASPPNFTTTGIYSTTVSPTAVPSSELVLPPADYFGPTDCYTFPADFIFGVAGSSAQIEGAVAMEGKGPNLMDVFARPGIADNYVTNENYFLYKQDIERLAAMGVRYYSFSIAWSRILPFALPGTPVNSAGIAHYDDLINYTLAKGMIPTVTMLHFDTPLQFYAANVTDRFKDVLIGYVNGAYQNATFEDAFVNYARILLAHYSDRVPVWFTFNEPLLYSDNGASINSVVKAHARVAHYYKDVVRGTGKIGVKLNDNFGVPRDPRNDSDVAAANHFNDFQLATFWNPLVLGEDYPDAFKMTIPDYVPLSAGDLSYMRGTCDFVAVDPYTATVVSQPPGGIADCVINASSPYFPYCVVQETNNTFGWNIGYRSYSYVYITPTYLRTYLNYLWNTFRAPVFITEFGFPVFGEADKASVADMVFDTPRSLYYLSFMTEVLRAIWEDGVAVMGALAWSFADNWEFGDYRARFGMQVVERETQTRYFKKSFFDLVAFVRDRHPNYEAA